MFSTKLHNFSKPVIQKLSKIDRNHIFSKLNLRDFDIDIDDLSKLRLSFNDLPIDTYYPENKEIPSRYRRYASFQININQDVINVKQIYKNNFSQNVVDFRSFMRYFEPIKEDIIKEQLIQLFVPPLSLTHYFNQKPEQCEYKLDVHQVRLLSFANQPSDNAPEGIHQDGADYIISAMILNKHNIENDTSVIYDENKKEIFRTNLNTGDFIFQDDIKLWHDIKPINAVGNYNGYRDIIGFDISIL